MGPTICLFACVLAVSQPAPAERSDWLLVPQMTRGQELVYRGTFAEESVGTAVQCDRAYRLETRVFVLDHDSQGADLAFLTVLKPRTAPRQPGGGAAAETSSVRLEMGRIDSHGRVSAAPGCALAVPLEGPPTIENGMFIEVPRNRGSIGQVWDAGETNRPSRSWQIAGSEAINGTTCVKLVGVQQSADWDHPRADSTAWRRRDAVWFVPRGGYAYRIERIIERREPARREVSQKSVTRYELESSLQYPGQMGSDRQREITLARTVTETLTPLLPNAGKVGPSPFQAVLARISYHTDHVPPTPYRAVLQQLQARAEAGRRGESPPPVVTEDRGPASPVVALGRPAPDFLVKDLTTTESTGLRRWLGHPILLVFYNPTSQTAEEVLHFAQSICTAHGPHVTVLGLAVADDTDRILKQRAELHLEFPILAGTGLRLSYALDTTPKLVVIDSAGMVRCSLVGWGPETAATITDELLRGMQTDEPAGKPER